MAETRKISFISEVIEDEIETSISSSSSTISVEVDDSKGDNRTDNNFVSMDDIKAREKEIKEELEKIKVLQNELDEYTGSKNLSGLRSPMNLTLESKIEVDKRSIHVGNVDYGTTVEELKTHFNGCGPITRVTIPCNKFNGHPKGFAYIEFEDKDSIEIAMALDETLFRGRAIKIMPKRTNTPGISTTNRPPRGRGYFRGSRGYLGRRNFRKPMSYRKGYFPAPY